MEGGDLDLGCPGFVADAFLEKLDPQGGGESWIFRTIFRDGNNHLIKEAGGAGEDIEMAEGDGIESAWINGASAQVQRRISRRDRHQCAT